MTAELRRRLAGAGDDESGMVTAFVVIFTLALLAMAGLVLCCLFACAYVDGLGLIVALRRLN